MAAIYEYTGVVEKVLQLQSFASGFTKRDVVMTDDVGAESKWPNHIAFTFKKDAASMLDTVREGQRAKIRFAIDGREWTNPQGQVKYFTSVPVRRHYGQEPDCRRDQDPARRRFRRKLQGLRRRCPVHCQPVHVCKTRSGHHRPQEDRFPYGR